MSEVKKTDLFESGIKEEVEAISKAFSGMVKDMDAIIKQGGKFNETLSTTAKTQKQLKESTEGVNKNNDKLKQTTVELNKVNVKALKSWNDQVKASKKLNTQKAREIKLAKKQAIESNKVATSYNTINNTLKKSVEKYKALSEAQRTGSRSGKQLLKQIQSQEKALKKMDASMGKHNRSVGNYGKAMGGLKSILGAAGLAGGVMMFTNAIKASIRTLTQFSRANSRLAAILGVNKKETKDLADEAKRLGTITKYTAVEVSNLQIEYAKLGFSQKEIISLTEATLNLASASGSDLANAASIAGGTMRAFGLDASDSAMVTDVMAQAFSSSALDIEKFSVAMRTAGPVAKSAGVSIQDATAQIGSLANANVEASTAGTSLRNIYLELSKTGMTYSEAMSKIANSSNKNATAMALFGKKSATAAIILSDSAKSTNELATALYDSEGAAKKMAETMEDNIIGDVTKLGSAWDGWILSMDSGDSLIGKMVRGSLQELSDIFVNLADGVRSLDEATKKAQSQILKDNETNDVKEYKEYIDKLKESMSKYGKEVDIVAAAESYLSNSRMGITRHQEELKIIMEKIKSSKTLTEDELKAYESEISQIQFKIKIEKERINNVNAYGEARKVADEKQKQAMKDAANETKKANDKINKSNTAAATKAKKAHEKAINERIQSIKQATQEEIREVKSLYVDKKITAQEAEDRILEITKNGTAKQIENLESLLATEKDNSASSVAIAKALTASKAALYDENVKNHKDSEQLIDDMLDEADEAELESIQKTEDATLASEEKKKQAKLDTMYASVDAANAMFDLGSALMEREQENLSFSQKKELENFKGTEEQKEKLEKKHAAEQLKLRRKMAILDKAQAIFNIGVNTATGITAALATGNIPLSIVIGIMGAAQLAAVAAKPLPKFKDGVTDFGGGLAVVSDGAGDEIIETPTGTYLAKGEQTLNLPKHTNVYTAEESKRMLSNNFDVADSSDAAIMMVHAEINDLKNVVKNKDEVNINITGRGLSVLKGSNDRYNNWLNSLTE